MSDSLGSTNVQKLSLLFSGIFYIWLGQIDQLWAVNLIIFIMATASGMMYPANSTSMARLCSSENITKGFALNRLANNIGVTIGPAVGGFLALHNYKLLFWVDGLTCIAAVVLFSLLWKSPETELRAQEGKHSVTGRFPWFDIPFLLILPMITIWGMIFHQLFATFPIYMRGVYGFPENRIGLLVMINTLLIVTLEMLLIHWMGKRSLMRIMATAFLLTGVGFALLPLGRGFVFAAFTVAIWTFGEMLSMPLLGAFIIQRAGEGKRGIYMGFYSFAFSVSLIAGPALGTYVYSRFGPAYLWFGCGVAGFVLFVLFRIIGSFLLESPASVEL
ncbi:MAG: MFS transporter [Candidatus Aminicenantes bacterium]|nr:MFS transporter [Candidatus Aminicenantes bacterium]